MSDHLKKAHSRRVDIFNVDVYLFFDEKEMSKACIDFNKLGDAEDALDCSGISFEPILHNGRNMFMIGVFDESKSTLMHEVSHVVFRILENVGIDPRPNAGELFCYMLEHLYGLFEPLLVESISQQ